MAQTERVAYFSTLCEKLYIPSLPQERDQAQAILEYALPTFADAAGNGIASRQPPPPGLDTNNSFAIETPTDTASAIRVLLENSPSPYVQIFCLSRLKQLITAQFSLFSNETKLQLRTFLLEYCFNHPDLQTFVITQLAGIFALLVRMGWLDLEDYQNVIQAMDPFFSATVDHSIIGLQMLAVIIQDINDPNPVRFATKFRKAASGFRDTQLLSIFKTALKTLDELLNHSVPFEKNGQEERLQSATLDVLIRCLSYDFAGTASLEDMGDDTGTVQIPASWRLIYEDEQFIPRFFTAYREFGSQASKVMECLVLVASTRKALFSGSGDRERSKFIVSLMQGTGEVIASFQGMNDSKCYNEFCRLLHRFRAAISPNELAEKPGYAEWVQQVAEFTIKAIESWKWAPNTISYLLGFWSRTVQNMSYYQHLGDTVTKKLEDITTQIVRAYIKTNVNSVPERLEDMVGEDPLDNEDSLVDTLSMLGQIARCRYQESSASLIEVFDPIAAQYQELIGQISVASPDNIKHALAVIETKFAWLVYIMAVYVNNQPSCATSEDNDLIDSKLMTKVLQLMYVNEGVRTQYGNTLLNEKMDLAILCFFQHFRKTYIGDRHSKSIYTNTTEVFGISDQVAMLNVILKKIISNLQCWNDSEQVIRRTLELFNDLSSGYTSLKNMRKLEATKLFLQNHRSKEFDLHQEKHKRSRMVYYQVLCRILFSDDNCDAAFDAFMKPFDEELGEITALSTLDAFQQEPVKEKLVVIFRDLRSFIMPIQNRRNFQLFFDWFYPSYMPVIFRALEAWSPNPIANTLLKFISEFVHNKSQRLNFDISSPNGILVFRDVSRIICTHGRRVLESNVMDKSNLYAQKYKGISVCYLILSRCLGGRYINFGVFWLYQDKAIDDAFNVMFQLMLGVPLQDLMDFPKLSRSYFQLLDDLCCEQLTVLPTLPNDVCNYIFQSIELGLETSDTHVRPHACTSIYHICAFVAKEFEATNVLTHPLSLDVSQPPLSFRRRRSSVGSTPSHWLLQYLQQNPRVLPSLLSILFGLVLFEENNDPWQLSRTLYALMLLQKEFAVEYTNKVISQQLVERQAFVAKGLQKLMSGVEWTFSASDRDQFTRNVSNFRRELSLHQVSLVPLPSVF